MVRTAPVSVESGAVGRRGVQPVHLWGGVGGAFLLAQVAVWTAWWASGHAGAVDPGPLSADTRRWAAGVDALSVLSSALVAGVVVRGCLRRRRLTTDGLLILAFLSVYWIETGFNFVRVQFIYSAALTNVGSWLGQIPGWVSPNADRLPQTYLVTGVGIIGYSYTMSVLASLVIRKVAGGGGRPGPAFAAAFGVLAVTDLVFESLLIRTELFAYVGAISELSLGGGTKHQIPVYAALLWVLFLTVMGFARWRAAETGTLPFERGVDQLGGSGRLWRVGAGVGFANVAVLVLYILPLNLTAFFNDPFPPGLASHINRGVCGPGAGAVCPGPNVPIRSAPDRSPESPQGLGR